MRALVGREGAGPSELAAGKKFGGYKPEAEGRAGAPSVSRSERFEAILSLWSSLRFGWGFFLDNYPIIEDRVRGLQCSPREVADFSIALSGITRQLEIAGMFLSALANTGPSRTYRVYSTGYECLGCYNEKNLIVYGDAGESLGAFMKKGRLLVRGNAGKEAGAYMSGGSIVISGDSGPFLGEGMSGGSISVLGKMEGLGMNTEGGRIYHRGVLI
ncbi:MAG: hypothetical protein AB1529_01730 [Candidatus Micrarchaeota archaeon]